MIVTLRTELLGTQRNSNPIGSITFSYDDQAGIGETGQEPVFRLTRLRLEFFPGVIDLDGLRNGVNVDRSPMLADKQLAVSFTEGSFQEGERYRVLELQEDRPYWRFQVIPNPAVDFMVFTPVRRPVLSWDLLRGGTVAGTGRAAPENRLASGVVGATVVVPPAPVPVINVGFPMQSPPVRRSLLVNTNLSGVIAPDPNNPMVFLEPTHCGCHLLSPPSARICLTNCAVLFR
jgi:hypothetical protein